MNAARSQRFQLRSLPVRTKRGGLLRFSLSLTLLLALGCILVLIYSRRQTGPPPLLRFGLEHCNDVPCFRGLEPEQTNWDTALALFEGRWSVIDDPHFAQIALFMGRDNRLLGSVFLDLPLDPAFTLSAVLSQYGKPDCVQVYALTNVVILHYPRMHVLSRFVQDRLRPTNPVTAVLVGAYGPRAEQLRDPCMLDRRDALEQLTVKQPWIGFAPQRRYLDGFF